MYKIFIVFLFFPIITFSQITIQEDNKSNAKHFLGSNNFESPFTFSLSTGVTLQRGIDLYTGQEKFTVFYLKGNGNYDIALNQLLNLYNQFGLFIKYKNKKEVEHGPSPYNPEVLVFEDHYPFMFNAEINYNLGLEMMIVQKLHHHLGVTFRLLNLYNATWNSTYRSVYIFGRQSAILSNYSNYWGGFNYGLDYQITNRIITNINLSRMFTRRPFFIEGYNDNIDLVTEISFGMTYKF